MWGAALWQPFGDLCTGSRMVLNWILECNVDWGRVAEEGWALSGFTQLGNSRFEVPRTVFLKKQALCDVMPCRLVHSSGRFEGPCRVTPPWSA